MAGSISNIGKVPELRRRILFTLMILAVYRLGVFITIPGVNRVEMQHVVTKGGSGTFLGMFDMFSGGALQQFSIFTLGIMPYVTSSIVMQLLTVVIPKLDQLNKEGEQGRAKINQYTRYGTILVAAVQAWFAASYVESLSRGGAEVVADPGMAFHLLTVLTMTTGTAVIMWMGELITDNGIGNGSSMIIFAGIVAHMPDALTQFLSGGSGGGVGGLTILFMMVLVFGTIAAICYFERAHRRIPVQYTKRQVGRKMYSGAQSYLPLKINVSGVIPPIFASSILMFPAQIANMANAGWLQEFSSVLHPADWRYNAIFTVLVVFFAFFYTSVVFNPVDVADNLKKSGGFIPGIRPGKNTAQYIERVLSRITFAGALYLSVVCMIPSLLQKYLSVPFSFGGTGLLIVVGVALDTVQQIESHLITRNYEGFAGPKGPRIHLKSKDELNLMREAGLIAAEILEEMCVAAKPGVSTWELDRIAARGIDKHKVTSAFLGYHGYPSVLCTSINEVVVHGIPRKTEVLKDGDIIGIDFGIFKHGFCADTARTVLVGDVSPEKQELVTTARESLEAAIALCKPGSRLGDLGHAIQSYAESRGYSVVRQFVGHGIGRQMHEDPQVPNFGKPGTEKRLKTGLVIAVEPMVNAGAPEVEVLDDNWTAVTKDRSMSAHFEHTIAVTDDGPWVLTKP